MLRLSIICLIILVLKSEFVKTFHDAGGGEEDVFEKTGNVERILHRYERSSEAPQRTMNVIYAMIGVIVLLCFIIIALIIYICKLKKRECDDDDIVDMIKTDTSKYSRQISSETTDASITRENSREDPRLKFTRHESKMSIVNYPINQEINTVNKHKETHSSTSTLSKIVQLQQQTQNQEQIRKICEAVIEQSQKKNVYSSLSNLDKIINESKAKESDNATAKDKSASAGLLDAVDDHEDSLYPISVKHVIKSFEVFPSPIAPRKIKNIIENKPQISKKIDDDVEPKPIIDSCLLKMTTDDANLVGVETGTEDEIYDNPPQFIKPVIVTESDEHADDIYVDAPSNKPVVFRKDDDDFVDELYDNIPNNRPVTLKDEENLDDIYDNPVSNKPISIDIAPTDCYVDLTGYKPNYATVVKDKPRDDFTLEMFDGRSASSIQNVKKDSNVKDLLNRKGIAVTNDEQSDYSLTLTSDTESSFDSSYVNAKTYNC